MIFFFKATMQEANFWQFLSYRIVFQYVLTPFKERFHFKGFLWKTDKKNKQTKHLQTILWKC